MQARPFSLRNRPSLTDGTLSVDVPHVLRQRLWALLENANHSVGVQRDPNDRWIDNSTVLAEVERSLKVYYGLRQLVDVRKIEDPHSTVGAYLMSCPHSRAWDIVEVFLSFYEGDPGLEGALNHTLEEEGSAWRIRRGLFESIDLLIPESVRRDLFDALKLDGIRWWGRLDEIDFLSRIFDLESLPSSDSRYRTMDGDIRQHRYANEDWDDDWVYSDKRLDLLNCNESIFIQFLELLVDPLVRPDEVEAASLAKAFNATLGDTRFEFRKDGVRAGRASWRCRKRGDGAPLAVATVRKVTAKLDREHLDKLVERLSRALQIEDVELVIGTAKELVESVCISILVEHGSKPEKDWDLGRLVGEVRELLQVAPKHIPGERAAADTIKRVLGNLGQVTQGIAELRNAYGTGHGRDGAAKGLQMRHARLVAGMASTLAVFLFETNQERPPKAQSGPAKP